MGKIQRKMNEKKKQKVNKMSRTSGITLIALVVTIVVLLILAGITITFVLGENGIINMAQRAADATNKAMEKEQNDLGDITNQMQNYLNGNDGGNNQDPEKPLITTDGSYNADKEVNSPKLGPGMIPITWNGNEWVEAKTDDEWYSYTEADKKWANAKTGDGSMWVWIPRYAYQIESGYQTSEAGVINIKFLKGKSNEATDGKTSWDNASGQGNWNIHPAFTVNEENGGWKEELAGIWVAKFEASKNDATASSAGSGTSIKVQPGVVSWRSIKVNDIFNNCKNYNSALNSHMMKNSEWGACAYLSKSIYGINGEIWINPNSNYVTGQAGNSVSASGTSSTNAYQTSNGVKASTTGNVYGIYDMSGGAWEYVASYANNGHNYLQTYGASLVNSSSGHLKQVYSKGSSDDYEANYQSNKGRYGDAVYETSTAGSGTTSWYDDYSSFPDASNPFFLRGGHYSYGSTAGAFYFTDYTGNSYSNHGFRPVLAL